ncbi:MAG: NrfD/PsrC family molybdoenzyme membrane anchor subunit, partial [Elusimicrobiota bacterium]
MSTERPWTFYVQGAAVALFSLFALAVNGWFIWRAWSLRELGDAWTPALLFGAVLGPLFLVLAGILWTIFLKIAASEKPIGPRSLSLVEQEEALIEPVLGKPTAGFLATVALLACFSLWAVFAWGWQLYHGLQVTGLNNPVFWGFYITNFVFFIGISHAGTLISAILRIANAEWRRSITRSAEVITVLVLVFGAGNIILDLGRPDRALNVFLFGRLQSPLLWDVCSITAYLTGSTLYLYLPLIPDIAILRDRCADWRQPLYDLLSFGWSGTKEEMRVLEKCIAVMAIVVIPVAVSVHTVVSYVFSMTIQPMWHSTIFGPYFVVGAIFSGIAALIIAMAALRRVYGLEEYLRPIHFKNLGLLLLVMSCLWLYFTFSEFLTTWYGNDPEHIVIFYSKLSGPYAPFF